MHTPSPFLTIPASDHVVSNALAFAIRDRFPVSAGHTLVIPRREVPTWFEATRDEQLAILDLIDAVKRDLDALLPRPDGYNVGFNAGAAAGQTVIHLHVHVIPRYEGDMDDPRGGVRHVIPSRGNYMTKEPRLSTGDRDDPFVAHLHPLFARATDIAIVAAFVQLSGLERLRSALVGAVERGARVRLLTGDYLHITQAEALAALLDLSHALGAGHSGNEPRSGLSARVFRTGHLRTHPQSFHPKSWRFEGPGFAVAFVGSSNLSRSALEHGIEWNLRVDRDRDAEAWKRLCDAYEILWTHGSTAVLDDDFVQRYRASAIAAAFTLPPGDAEPEAFPSIPEAHAVQREALDALALSRHNGHTRALVVMATGLGKTWLAAFDVASLTIAWGGFPRVLFVAHRTEILEQTAGVFRTLVRDCSPASSVAWYDGDARAFNARVVLASVALLSRPEHLARIPTPDHFDYVVVDEVHHATADSYRRILDRLRPRFLLGLTATPDRADEADVAGLFDDHVSFRADLGRGIEVGRLVPFAYLGLRDTVDYANIPWRSNRFDSLALSTAVETTERMERLWKAWIEHPGTRTLVFCCSVAHADFVLQWLVDRGRGVRAVCVHSGATSSDRTVALAQLRDGTIDAICTVDMLSEGVDLPAVDRIVMLRPTESPVVFLQQLGRGLRKDDHKTFLTVIDFVGNHRMFLDRVRRLFSFASPDAPIELTAALVSRGPITLPHGCSVELELEAKNLLRVLMGRSSGSEIERVFRELVAARGERPRAGELLRMGYSVASLRPRYEGWFDFVAKSGQLTDGEQRVFDAASAWLREVEVTEMTRCFNMILLEAVLESDALRTGLSLDDLARRSHAVLRRSPELFATVTEPERFADITTPASFTAWRSYWRTNPVAAWTQGRAGRRTWFRLMGDHFEPLLPAVPGLDDVLADMTRELVDLRLASARWRQSAETRPGFICKVTWNQRDPILKLPAGAQGDVPREKVLDVRLPDGSVRMFRCAREFINVATAPGVARNELPDLLRAWFGPGAGKPGTSRQVRFWRVGEAWHVEPVAIDSAVADDGPSLDIPSYPDLRVAAGVAIGASEAPEQDVVRLPTVKHAAGVFAVRATGLSMEGGARPIHDGDWLVFRWARSVAVSGIRGRVALIETAVQGAGFRYQVKRVVEREGRWWLESDNPVVPPMEATDASTVVALLEEVVSPEGIGPAPGTLLRADDLAAAFGLEAIPPTTGRYGGHLFVFVTAPGNFTEPDTLRVPGLSPRPGETAFVLTSSDKDTWRHCGVAHRLEDGLDWRLPPLDHPTWKRLGEGRSASKRLSPEVPDRAKELVARAIQDILAVPVTTRAGKVFRIVGASAKGGLRIDGGEGGFAERTVSLTDIAWVLAARDDVARNGGVLDRVRVHRLRYLDGTPEGATRYIDTEWAIAIVDRLLGTDTGRN